MNDIQIIFAKPVKRQDLALVLGCESDREARRILSELQKSYNIINLQDGKGYYLADDETVMKYAMQERSRALKSLQKANNMIRRCQHGGGYSVPVRAHMRRIGRREAMADGQVVFELEAPHEPY